MSYQADVITEARGWISDCYWADVDDAGDLTDDEVFRGIGRRYQGGWRGFLADGLIIEFASKLTDDEIIALHVATRH